MNTRGDARRLVMVYNAPGGLLWAIRDSFWKTFAPASYPCALCALAFGFFTAHGDWKRFLTRVQIGKTELHSDDYRAALPGFAGRLPAILLIDGDGEPQMIAYAEEMEAMTRLDQLIELAEARLRAAGVAVGDESA